MKREIIFQCPRCESKSYGSSIVNGKFERLCHGLDRYSRTATTRCTFKWKQDDDWKYFSIRIRFDSKEEFEEHGHAFSMWVLQVPQKAQAFNETATKPETKTRAPGWASEVSDKKES